MVNCNFFEIKLDNRCWEWSDLDSWISNIGFHCQFLKQNSKSKNQRTHPPKKNINKLIYTFFHIKKTHKYVQILYPTDLGLGVEHRLARKSQDVHLKQPGHLLLSHAGTFGWSGVIGGLVLERLHQWGRRRRFDDGHLLCHRNGWLLLDGLLLPSSFPSSCCPEAPYLFLPALRLCLDPSRMEAWTPVCSHPLLRFLHCYDTVLRQLHEKGVDALMWRTMT